MAVSTQNLEHRSLQILRRTYVCGLSYRAQRHIVLLQDLEDLTPAQKTRIINRYVEIIEELHKRKLLYAFVFHIGRFVVTVGSLIVPALLSIQYTDTTTSNTPESFSYNIYWATWVISLMVTIFNGILTLFKIDKKYYFLHTTTEQFQSEVWQYIHLTGKYAGYYTKGKPVNHSSQYIYFCHAIEKIKLKQVEEEYFKVGESTTKEKHLQTDLSGNTTVGGTQDSKVIAGIFAPTPDQDTLVQHQQKLASAVFRRPAITEMTVKEETPKSPSIENSIVIIDGPSSEEDARSQNSETDERGEVSVPSKNTVSV